LAFFESASAFNAQDIASISLSAAYGTFASTSLNSSAQTL